MKDDLFGHGKPISEMKTVISDSEIDNVITKKVKPTFEGPFKIKAEVLKAAKFRIDGKLYDLRSGEFFDGSKLTPRKREILIAQKYIQIVNQ